METINEVNEIQITYNPRPAIKYKAICSSIEVNEVLTMIFPENQIALKEFFYVLLLNQANGILGYFRLSEGGITSTPVDVRGIFQVALKANATGVLVAHNHPSGVAEPSVADERITERLKEALALIDIRVLDHLIVGDSSVVSFAERGLL